MPTCQWSIQKDWLHIEQKPACCYCSALLPNYALPIMEYMSHTLSHYPLSYMSVHIAQMQPERPQPYGAAIASHLIDTGTAQPALHEHIRGLAMAALHKTCCLAVH